MSMGNSICLTSLGWSTMYKMFLKHLFKLHFVLMFANETVLRTPSGGLLCDWRCNIDSMTSFKTLLKASNAHATYVNKV